MTDSDPDWPDDIGAENPDWEPDPFAPDISTMEEYDAWARGEPDPPHECMVACGTCHPEMMQMGRRSL